MDTIKVTIEPYLSTSSPNTHAQRYRVWCDGECLIENTNNPEYDACRVLLAKGITGRLETWRKDTPYPCMVLDIEKGAKLTIRENATDGPGVALWRPFPGVAGTPVSPEIPEGTNTPPGMLLAA